MAERVIHVHLMTTDAGECPMCGFDSLRRVTGHHLTEHGVTTVFDVEHCGRCINDIREIGNA